MSHSGYNHLSLPTAHISDRIHSEAENIQGMDLLNQLRAIAKSVDQGTYSFVMLLPKIDRLKLWRLEGHKSCISWINAICGMSPSAAGDRRRVGYALEVLPIIRQLFEIGKLSWSKVRALTRIATPDNEHELASNALYQSASDIELLAKQYRHTDSASDLENEDAIAAAQYQNRRVTYRFDDAGMVRIHALLSPLEGAAVIKSMERAEDAVYAESNGNLDIHKVRLPKHDTELEDPSQMTPTQLRADALCLMAMKHLSAESTDIRTADRYQVVVHVDAEVLGQTPDDRSGASMCHIEGGPKIAASAARRIADDCSIVPLVMKHGEPLSIGRKSRVWTAPIARAIMARDHKCQFPGCSAQRHLHFHHLTHWADNGETSVDGGVALCGFHHRLVHEQHYKVIKTPLDVNGKLPTKTVEVITADGHVVQLTSPVKRFNVQRPDGSVVGCEL